MSIVSDLAKMYELWNSWKDRQLTEPDQELLLWARENQHPYPGAIYVRRTDQTGEFIVVGQRLLIDDQDPVIRVRYLDALEKLFRRGLARHESGKLFVLAEAGWEEARKLS